MAKPMRKIATPNVRKLKGKIRHYPKIGDRVRIKGYHPDYNGMTARVINVDGSYILVRPSWKRYEVDLLDCEVEVI